MNPLTETIGLPGVSTLRRMMASYCPLALYYLLRLLTCVPPVVASLTRNAPDENLRFGIGLVIYAAALGFIVATTYTILLRSFMTGGHDGIRRRRSMIVVTVVGGVDMAAGLAAIVLSGGWGSPFWHAWLSSLVVPCLVLGMGRSLALAAGYVATVTAVLIVTGESIAGVWAGAHRYLYVGSMFTLFLLSGVVGYLGDVCFALQRSRTRAEAALANMGTMLEITRSVAVITTNVNEMMRRVAQTIGERHRYDTVGIYLSGPDGRDMRLAGWVGDPESLQRYAQQSDHLIHQAVSHMDTRSAQDDRSWSAAMPIRDSGSLLGVLLVAHEGSGRAPPGARVLESALTSQIAVGIRTAGLRERTDAAMSGHEWELLTGRIHDRITSSLYAQVLHLGAYSKMAERENNPMAERLAWLLPHVRHLLFYTRQYVYRLLPLMRGERGLDAVFRHVARDFETMSGVDVRVSLSGPVGRLPLPGIVTCYDMVHHRMADVFHGATATEMRIDLEMTDHGIRLSIADDGAVEEDDNEMAREGIGRIRRLAGSVGGDLRISESQGSGTLIVLDLAIQDGGTTLDNSADRRRERIPENRSQNGTGV